jgi:hypothetical protein
MTQTISLYHGTWTADMQLHQGLCLTPEWSAARRYAEQWIGTDGDSTPGVHTVELNLRGLIVVELDETWDSQDAARFGDHCVYQGGADILIYQDYALSPVETMTTYRLMTAAAVAAIRVVDSQAV